MTRTWGPLRILALTSIFTGATIAYVHLSQLAERERMRAAVLRDIERERARS